MRRPVLAALVVAGVLAVPAAAPAAPASACPDAPSAECLLPFPNDQALTVPDARTATGLRVRLRPGAMPANAAGVRIDPTEWNRNDGFSPGQPVLARVPGIDSQAAFARSRIVPVDDIGAYRRRDQPVVVVDTQTGRRHPIWVDLDANATANPLLVIHPAVNLEEGRRYVVALRGLRDASGRRIPAPPRFRAQRDAVRPNDRHASIFRTLGRAGIARRGLYLAWDFTVASRRSLTARALRIRNDAFAQLGDRNLRDGRVAGRAPTFAVTQVTEPTPEQNPRLARQITGTLTVPCYLDQAGCPPGARYHYGSAAPDALPTQIPGNTHTVPFVCNVPRVASPTAPARLSLYGHGLLGRPTEINAGNVQDMSQEHNFVFCATPWVGMANEDIGNAIAILGEVSRFPSLTDRLQQGFLNAMMLGRAMIHPQGLSAHPAFRRDGRPLVDTRDLFYDGNSQGGIAGGALTALAPDFRRAVLGVPGMDYATLLPRSVDFDTYRLVFDPAYPDRSEQQVVLSLIQMLWDRGEANGYAHHMTDDPLPGTPSHDVLMHVAFSDHQVANATADVEARTIGARAYRPALAPGRSPDRRPLWGIPAIPRFPWTGSAIVYWDSGTPPPPTTNVPPRAGEDPHEDPRATPAARVQKSTFLRRDGSVVDVCGGAPCRTAAYAPQP